jgi:uncharacterized protein (TIGR02444 family)
MIQDSENPFWAFSLTLYVREGVTAACLDLQDRLDLDVNLLLFCCWAGSQGRVLSEAEIASLIAATRDWRGQVIRPLRDARRWLKGRSREFGDAATELREDIKANELTAEAIQQGILHATLPVPLGAASPRALAANLRSYLAAEGCRPGPADMGALVLLLLGAAPGLDSSEARRLLAG